MIGEITKETAKPKNKVKRKRRKKRTIKNLIPTCALTNRMPEVIKARKMENKRLIESLKFEKEREAMMGKAKWESY